MKKQGRGKPCVLFAALFALVSLQTAEAAFVEDFDTFSLGALVAQESWDFNASVNVVTNDSGRALNSISAVDKTTRHGDTGVDFDLSGAEGGLEYGFDVREEDTTTFNCRMFLREGGINDPIRRRFMI